jgi:class 3 adenylate cyclase
MTETRKIAAILVADVVGYSRLAGADEDRTLSRLRGLRSDLIDPAIDAHHGRIVKRTGDGILIEFRSVVDAARCAIEVQQGLIERNTGLPPERRIEFLVGVHLGDVVEESDGDLMGDDVNIAARLESICEAGAIFLSEDAYRQVKGRLDLAVTDLGPTQLKNIAEPIRVYSLQVGAPAVAKPAAAAKASAPRARRMKRSPGVEGKRGGRGLSVNAGAVDGSPPVVSLITRLAPIIDRKRPRLRAIGEDCQKLAQPQVGAMLGDEPLHVVAPAPPHGRLAHVGQSDRIARHCRSAPFRDLAPNP